MDDFATDEIMGAYGIQHNYNSNLDPNMVQFKALNLVKGKKMKVHKSQRMVASICEGLRQSNEKFYINNFKGASNIGPAQFFKSDQKGIAR